MKTIKIIDLLNKIAKGEEVPKKIKYCRIEFNFDGGDYLSVGNLKYDIPSDTSIFKWCFGQDLNDEVEIINDENIEKIDLFIEKIDLYKGKPEGSVVFNEDILMQNKINELIDEVNKLKESK